MHPIRARLERSPLLARFLARFVGTYLRICRATTRWNVTGLEQLKADLRDGPVLLVMWHERSLMGPLNWPVADGQLSSLYAGSPIGRISGAMQRQFGLHPMEMAVEQSNVVASRKILRRVREGVSIGMTGDGPHGPALQVKDAPLDWARAMGRPVYGFAFATIRHKRLKAWDRMIVPLPFTRGAVCFARLSVDVPRKLDADGIEALRKTVFDLLTDTAAQADNAL